MQRILIAIPQSNELQPLLSRLNRLGHPSHSQDDKSLARATTKPRLLERLTIAFERRGNGLLDGQRHFRT